VIAAAMVMLLSLSGAVVSASAATKTPVSIRVTLNTTTVHAGHVIHGTAILTNASSKSILVQTWECDQWLFVGLANNQITYDPAVPTSACAHSITLKPGPNRVPITVSTKYQVCGGGTQKGTIAVPHCTKSGMPALPKGTYRVVVITNGEPTLTPYASRVRITLS
jgi:hypothetical protein